MKILVTGGAGFMGKTVVNDLLAHQPAYYLEGLGISGLTL